MITYEDECCACATPAYPCIGDACHHRKDNNEIDFDKMIEIIHNAPISFGYCYDGSIQIKEHSYIITQTDMVKLLNYVRYLN